VTAILLSHSQAGDSALAYAKLQNVRVVATFDLDYRLVQVARSECRVYSYYERLILLFDLYVKVILGLFCQVSPDVIVISGVPLTVTAPRCPGAATTYHTVCVLSSPSRVTCVAHRDLRSQYPCSLLWHCQLAAFDIVEVTNRTFLGILIARAVKGMFRIPLSFPF
jgi:hypothetical protein